MEIRFNCRMDVDGLTEKMENISMDLSPDGKLEVIKRNLQVIQLC